MTDLKCSCGHEKQYHIGKDNCCILCSEQTIAFMEGCFKFTPVIPLSEIRKLWEASGELAKYKRNDGTLKIDARARMCIFERKLKELSV
jgi:hypothetical protein